MRTRFTELFGVEHPVVCAPMGGVAGGRLAAAVTAAGGLGLVGVSYGDGDFVDEHVAHTAGLGGVWGVGCVMFTFDTRPGLWDKVTAYAPPVVALSFGDAEQVRRYVGLARAAGCRVLVQVHEPQQAVVAQQAGADALVVQGAEAGGHHKFRATLPLVPAVADAVGEALPLVAAGGVADGRGLAACLALGADAVMLGTRFAAAEESLASPGFRSALVRSGTDDTVNTRVFDLVRAIPWDRDYRARAVENDFARRWNDHEAELSAQRERIEPEWQDAVARDDVSQRAMFAGEVLDMVRDIRPAGDIVRTVVAEAEAVLTRIAPSRNPDPIRNEA